jgi:hypothetical protein
MDPEDPSTIENWQAKCFDAAEARAWIAAAPGRFTPWTAAAWRGEGFGPTDAALWSEIYTDPRAARNRRSAGYADPFEADVDPD